MLTRTLSLSDATLISNANASTYFGFTDWTSGVSKDIACTKPTTNDPKEPCVGSGFLFKAKLMSTDRITLNGLVYSK